MSAARVVEATGPAPAPAVPARSAYLVKGDDPSLVGQATHALCEELVGGGDPTLMVEEFGGPGADQFEVGAVIDACTTPPFLVERRIVVVRDAGQLNAADAKRLAAYLADPLPTTALVLVGGGGTVPQALTKVVGAVGEVVDTTVGRGRARSEWLAEHLSGGPVRLDGPAASRLSEHLGGDMGRLEGLLDTLASAYGSGATVTSTDLEPFLGEAGSLAPWDLTDAIDGGDTARALAVLHRMMGAGDTHPLVVMAHLHRHYHQILRLDGVGGLSPEQAAEILGMRSAFPAKKALAQSRRLGGTRIARALALLAEADLDLRGATLLPGETVLEVLVARLSRLVTRGRERRPRPVRS
jgi:DNA polymerase-3 subunit delta